MLARGQSCALIAAARESGLPLIVGSEFTLADGLRFVCLATSRRGYGALARLITQGRRAASKGRYRLGRVDLAAGPRGLPRPVAAGTAARGRGGRVAPRALRRPALARRGTAGGRPRPRAARAAHGARARIGVPAVAAGDVHMHQRRRRALQDTLTAVRLKTTVANAGHALHPNGERDAARARAASSALYPRGAHRGDAAHRGALPVLAGRASLRIPGGDRARGHDAGLAPAPPGRGRRGAALARGA